MQDLKLHYDTDVWLDLEGDQYWTSQSEKQAADDYKSYVIEQTIDEISPNLKNPEHPNHRQYVNQNYKELRTVNPSSREDHDLLLPLVLYSIAPITPKAASKQKDEKLVAAEEKAITDEMKSSADNGVIKAVNWKDIPKESRHRILRAFTFVVNKYDSNMI